MIESINEIFPCGCRLCCTGDQIHLYPCSDDCRVKSSFCEASSDLFPQALLFELAEEEGRLGRELFPEEVQALVKQRQEAN